MNLRYSQSQKQADPDHHILSRMISERLPDEVRDSLSMDDWDRLVRRAQVEGVAPMVYWVLSSSGNIKSLPEDLQHSLRGSYAHTWRQNQAILQELKTLAGQFERAGLQICLLKGACFALTIYADSGLRPMGDLDLLVPVNKLEEAVLMAESMGYRRTVPEASPGLSQLLDHAVCMQKSSDPSLWLELHRSLVGEAAFIYSVPVDWFWGQTEPLGGRSEERYESLGMLSPTAQVLYAAAHAALQHGGRNTPLRWYRDLDLLIRHYSDRLDWDLLLSQAREFDWTSALHASLIQTCSIFDTPVTQEFLGELAASSDRHRNLVEQLKERPATHILEEHQKLRVLKGYGRFRLLLALIAPSPTYMRWRYQFRSSLMLPVYYLVRWWGIMKDGARTIFSILGNWVHVLARS